MLDSGDERKMIITEIIDKLHMLQFFNQRAGRELWQSKPKEVQDKDVENADKYLSEAIKTLEEKAVSDEVYGNDSRYNVYFYMNEFLENGYSVSELIDILADVVREHEEEYGEEDV